MREKYFCPNCRAVITCGEKFCGNCGTALRWVIPQALAQPSSPSNSLQNNSNRQLQQSARPAGGDNAGNGKRALSAGTLAPLSAEIARLLVQFEKQLKNSAAIKQA